MIAAAPVAAKKKPLPDSFVAVETASRACQSSMGEPSTSQRRVRRERNSSLCLKGEVGPLEITQHRVRHMKGGGSRAGGALAFVVRMIEGGMDSGARLPPWFHKERGTLSSV